ncbi:L-tyrosine/L-tryptophan isonitrile synthase family protein [Erwinia amylovora]|uniref:L-tyrosine/L-tryptophan isonitrile synthase family protein n=1 Tax=Erwinia amylovora TaxID=552 RepID=UPI00144489C5|nr:isocyanide synthase family protein [Erwinia amylovora]
MSVHIHSDSPLLILREIDRNRRGYSAYKSCPDHRDLCECFKKTHHSKIKAFVKANRPIEFILPAFPAKSPNKNKVLGYLPDMAERISLAFLNDFCQRIERIYPPGAKLTICSDGRVFGDLIRTSDEKISAYQAGIRQLIADQRANRLDLFNLEDFQPFADCAGSFDEIRQRLIDEFAHPVEAIKRQLMTEEGGRRLYCAITRFLYEDGLMPGYSGSKSKLQQDSRQRAIRVIKRSQAWGALLAHHFPQAIRLSIHPQPAHSQKIGIHMIPTKDSWLTPWHGVAVEEEGKFMLMKRSEAESLGAHIVMRDNQQSHYQIGCPTLRDHCDLAKRKMP